MLDIRERSKERCAHQATICRESGAADHRQAKAGAHVEGFPLPQLESASTAAIRATRLEVILPLPLECAMADVVCFSSAVRIWRQYCRPHVASKLQAEQAHPSRRQQQQSLASISPVSISCPPRQPFAAYSGEREDMTGGGRSVITIGGQMAGSSEVECFGH